MLSRETATREALSELEALRARNYAEDERRRAELAARNPRAASLLLERAGLLRRSLQAAFSDPARAGAVSDALSARLTAIRDGLRAELAAEGLPEDWLQPVHRCARCGDTGYVGDLVKEPCVCLRSAVLRKLTAQEGLQGLAGQNFDRYDETVFPDEPLEGQKHSQREYMRLIRARCERYAETFRPGEGKGLLFYGETGVGKTFLLNCVAQRVLSAGHSVLFISAYRMGEALRQNQFDGSQAELVSDLLSCDLLAIDDLGSEPMRRESTAAGIYYVVNERVCAGRAIILSTNCSPQQLYERYGDRIAARLCDPGRMQVLRFPGQDVRRRAAEAAAAQKTEEGA